VRDDDHFQHVALWSYSPQEPQRLIEPLTFRYIKPETRSYK